MPIRFFIKQWLMPPGILFLLLLAAWWWRARRPRLAALCFGVGLGGLWLMSLPLVVQETARGLETEPPLAATGRQRLGEAGQPGRCHCGTGRGARTG